MKKKVYCEEKRENLNLTLSVRIFENNKLVTMKKIIKIQNIAKNYLPKQKNKSIYVYPNKTLHFSLFNFATFCLIGNFKSTRNAIKKQSWYRKFLKYVKKEVLPNLKLKADFKIRKLYLKENKVNGSLTLNLNANTPIIIKSLNNINQLKMKNKLLKIGVPKEALKKMGIKAYKKFFAINILRFFGKENSYIDNCQNFYKFIKNINKELKKKPIVFKLENPVVIVSDNYLSNPNPRILP